MSATSDLERSIDEIAAQWRSERAERQTRRQLDRRDFIEAGGNRSQDPAMAGDDLQLLVDQDRIRKAEFPQAGGDLADCGARQIALILRLFSFTQNEGA